MSVISLGDVVIECLSIFWWYTGTCLLYSINFGETDHITEMTLQINQCIHVDAESVSVLFSLFLLQSLSTLPPFVFISATALCLFCLWCGGIIFILSQTDTRCVYLFPACWLLFKAVSYWFLFLSSLWLTFWLPLPVCGCIAARSWINIIGMGRFSSWTAA